jgi:hypothetical protein
LKFIKKKIPNGYSGYGYAGTGTVLRVWVRGSGYAGKRVRVQRIFSKKKLTGPSQSRTRVPVYPPIPGHRYGYRGYTGTDCTRRVIANH